MSRVDKKKEHRRPHYEMSVEDFLRQKQGRWCYTDAEARKSWGYRPFERLGEQEAALTLDSIQAPMKEG